MNTPSLAYNGHTVRYNEGLLYFQELANGLYSTESESSLYLDILHLQDPFIVTPSEIYKHLNLGSGLAKQCMDNHLLKTKPGWSRTLCTVACNTDTIRPIGHIKLLHARIHINQWKWSGAKCEIAKQTRMNISYEKFIFNTSQAYITSCDKNSITFLPQQMGLMKKITILSSYCC
jgi:hypothetical protein